MPLVAGDQFDRYVLGDLLGKGGMGEVYRAHDTRLQRAVALKILRVPRGEDGSEGEKASTGGAARLLREARAAAAMDHPNAVAIFDVGECDGVPFLAMEFISGRTLRTYVGDGTVPLERRVRWLIDVARALGAAHRRGLVHRDVKPENVMIRDDGVVKVLDFGIARRSSLPVDPTASTEAVALETLTANGVVVGTPVYMAPEQMRGEPLDGRADQFAWAVVAYELLTGSVPWTATAPALQLVSQILSKEAEPPSRRNPAVPPEIDAAILRALAKPPRERFDAMEQIVPRLEPYAGISGQMAAPVPSARVPSKATFPSVPTQIATAGTPPLIPRARASSWRRWLVGGAAAVVALSAAVLVVRRTTGGGGSAETDAATTLAPVVLAWSDTGSAMSASAEALGAYHAGMQGVRDASMDRARNDLEHATQVDPTFAAAHLRAALVAEVFDTEARAHIQKAIQLRQSLSEHDRVLLDSVEPWTRVPPDLKESERRLARAVAKSPRDADALYALGATRHAMRDFRGALEALEAALASDPGIASAYRLKARAQLYLGDQAAATKTYDECLRVSPAATWCIKDRGDLDSNDGRCDEAEQLSRRLIALDPQSARGYVRLAGAVYGRAQPIESARVALEQAWQRTPAGRRKVTELAGRYELDVLVGDFAAADEKLAAWEREIAASPDEWDHTEPLHARMRIALETGRRDAAAKLAADYVKRRAAWTPDDFREDPSVYALETRYLAGAMPREAMDRERAEWLKREEERPARMGQAAGEGGLSWFLAYAAMTVDAEDARVALEALPRYLPLPDVLTRDVTMDDAFGTTYLRAGKVDDALPFLTRAARSCGALDHPLSQTVAHLHLGTALEAKGDRGGACATYRTVLDRWGNARPRSVSADQARARVQALGCGTGGG